MFHVKQWRAGEKNRAKSESQEGAVFASYILVDLCHYAR
jgi:hypothetical protein